jgi:hypothetical protein
MSLAEGEIDIDTLEELKVTELKELLKERELATDGKKNVLVGRLREFLHNKQEDTKKRKLEDGSEEEEESNKKPKFEHLGELVSFYSQTE